MATGNYFYADDFFNSDRYEIIIDIGGGGGFHEDIFHLDFKGYYIFNFWYYGSLLFGGGYEIYAEKGIPYDFETDVWYSDAGYEKTTPRIFDATYLDLNFSILYGYDLGFDIFNVFLYGGFGFGYPIISFVDTSDSVEVDFFNLHEIDVRWTGNFIVGTKFFIHDIGVFGEYRKSFSGDIDRISIGISFNIGSGDTSSPTPAPQPAPQPTPTPQPTPPPSPPVQQPQAGTVFYQYDGIGYVYLTDNVFYLCTNGRPVGYREGDTIYAFNGKVLGFYANAFIYDIRGNPVGADDPKKLGTDAAVRKQVSKAPQQDVPAKSPKQSVDKPRLKNGYFGGSLNTVF